MEKFRIIVFFAWALLGVGALLSAEPAVEPITKVSIIRSLSRGEAARALPVKLTGVVTYLGWENFVVHDGQASIFADFHFAKAKGYWKGPLTDLGNLTPGAEVEIDGVTDPGGFSPMVLVKKFRRIGTQKIPVPLKPSLGELISSSLDTQWVEVEGVVRKYQPDSPDGGPACLTLLLEGQRCPVVLRHPLKHSREQLVDARVRVRGVLLNIANLRAQMAGLKIHSNGDQDIDILIPPPVDPFQAPRVTLDRLIPFSPDADLDHRKVSSGVVTFVVSKRFFYMEDRGASVRVESQEQGIEPGDRVEVSGFIDSSHVLAVFSEARVRVTGQGTVPPAEPVNIAKILNPEVRSFSEMVTQPGHPDADGKLTRLTGVLRRVLPRDKDGNTTLFVESNGTLVRVFLPVLDGAAFQTVTRWIDGSAVELTGVCELEIDRLDHLPWFWISGFHVWLSSPEGLRVISTPPWWTPQRLAFLLAGLLLVLCLALVWGYAMRRQVAKRGRQLAGEIAAREAARLEFDAILHERRRLANDLHDTLEQALTGLALQLEIVDRSKSNDPERSARHLTLAQQFLERSRGEVHRTVWDLRAHGQDGRDFLDILQDRAAAMVAGSSVTITVEREGEAFALPDLLAGNLLLLAQEAVTNALKHATPGAIRICLKFTPKRVDLEVTDDGRGFDPQSSPGQHQGHFGLQGMHERVKRLGGTLQVRTSRGHGTSIIAEVPLVGESPPSDS